MSPMLYSMRSVSIFRSLLHSLATNTRRIFSEALFCQLLMCAATMAINLFALESSGLLSLRAISPIYQLLVILTTTFIYCYLSEALTTDLLEIGDLFYGIAWYRLPISAQSLLIPAIHHSQQEFRLKGAGLIDCSLFVFGKVSHTTHLRSNSQLL